MMSSWQLSSSHIHLLIHFIFIVLTPLKSLSYPTPGPYISNCSELFNCGTLTNVDFPFWGGDRSRRCGYPGLQLVCEDNNHATIEIMNVKYRVLNVSSDLQTLKLARNDYMEEGVCISQYINTTLDFNLFEYVPGYINMTYLYGCPSNLNMGYNISTCNVDGVADGNVYVLDGEHGPGDCNASVIFPVSEANWSGNYDQLPGQGFELKWNVDNQACGECSSSKGECGYDDQLNRTVCFCPNQSYGFASSCGTGAPKSSASGDSKSRTGLTIGLAVAGAAVVCVFIGFLFFCVRQRRKLAIANSIKKDLLAPPSSKSMLTRTADFHRKIPSMPSKRIDLEVASIYFGTQIFDYAELEEATDNFSKELGEGGFGVVYYGRLNDGRVVAVKRLYEQNFRTAEQFVNEVQILSRMRHKNLVALYGCTSRKSQRLILVYEYISNGTVADHIHNKSANSCFLAWPVRLSIAIETAEGLAYLHASEIIHRDVKTNNILLDDDFCVKVADFGLSRLFPTDVTHVSTAPQGTPGYVDPEYYQCYQLTTKSDVYSFGVVLMELLSSKEAVDTTRHRHEINLSNMAITKIQNGTLHEFVDPLLGFQTDRSVRWMATRVAELGFRCLQPDKDLRPTMQEAVETLKRIQREGQISGKAEIQDIEAGLDLKISPIPISPNSLVTPQWTSFSTTPTISSV